MLSRTARYWLCCTAFNTEEVLAEFQNVEAHVKLAQRPTNKFGPYDYIFIDSAESDQLLELALESLLEKLERNISAIARWGDAQTSGVEVIVRTNKNKYSEAVSPEILARLAKFNLQVSFTYEYISPESA